jgi:hypothetical protein
MGGQCSPAQFSKQAILNTLESLFETIDAAAL